MCHNMRSSWIALVFASILPANFLGVIEQEIAYFPLQYIYSI